MPSFSADTLKMAVQNGLPESLVTVEDMTGTNDHFQMTVVCDLFLNKSLVDRQRMVFKILGDTIGGPVHALTLKTLTTTEASNAATR